jgi:hypothetical protein
LDLRRLRKKKTDDHNDEKKEKKNQYETKREKNFRENWADEFPGVRHAVPLDEEGNIGYDRQSFFFLDVVNPNFVRSMSVYVSMSN